MLNTGSPIDTSKSHAAPVSPSRKRARDVQSDCDVLSPQEQPTKKTKLTSGHTVKAAKPSARQLRVDRQNDNIDQLRKMLNVPYKPETLERITAKNNIKYNLEAMTPFEQDSLVLRKIDSSSDLDNGEVLQLTIEFFKKYQQIARLSQYATGQPIDKSQIFRIAMEQVFPEQDIKPWYGCFHRRKGHQDAQDDSIEKETPPTLDYLPLPKCLLNTERTITQQNEIPPNTLKDTGSLEQASEAFDLEALMREFADDNGSDTTSPDSFDNYSYDGSRCDSCSLDESGYSTGDDGQSTPINTTDNSPSDTHDHGAEFGITDDPLALCEPEQQMLKTMDQLLPILDEWSEPAPDFDIPTDVAMPLVDAYLTMDLDEAAIDDLGDVSDLDPNDFWLPAATDEPMLTSMPCHTASNTISDAITHGIPQQYWQTPVVDNMPPSQLEAIVAKTSVKLQQLLGRCQRKY